LEILTGLYILAVITVQVVIIDFIFKMRSVIDIITSDSSFLIKRKLQRTRKIKYLIIILLTASIVVFEGVNYIVKNFPELF
jgi:hypothetical protein